MAGIVGAASPIAWNSDRLLKEMAGVMRYSMRSVTEIWIDPKCALGSVRVGAAGPLRQPVFSQDGTTCILMFGECFGYETERQRLASQGHRFNSEHSDAEFCMRLYEAEGEEAFTKLNGSFCLVLYDAAKQELRLISDRLGSRPLYYAVASDGKLYFATQVAPLLQAPGVSRRLDETAVVEFCALQRVLGTKTYHQGVRMLAPGSVLRYFGSKTEVASYWYPNYRAEPGSLEEYAEELADVMRTAVGRATRHGERTAMLLSGGLDARMVVAAADSGLVCYTFADYENPEVDAARQVASAGGCEFRFLQRRPDHYADLVDLAVEIGNGMHAFNHAHAIGFVEAIAEDFDVITHGFVPELLFRGYSLPKIPAGNPGIRTATRLDPTLTVGNLPQRLFRRGYSLLDKGIDRIFADGVRATLQERLLASAREIIAETEGHAEDIYDKFLWPDVYYHARYPSMLFELSLRPFIAERGLVFHNEVIDLHLKLSVALRADDALWLRALERLNRKVAHTVNANTGHSPFLSPAVQSMFRHGRKLAGRLPLLWRLGGQGARKLASAAHPGHSPISWPRFDWMIRNNAKLRATIVETLADPEALPPEIFHAGRIRALLDEHLANRGQHRTILFALLTFGRWHKRHGLT